MYLEIILVSFLTTKDQKVCYLAAPSTDHNGGGKSYFASVSPQVEWGWVRWTCGGDVSGLSVLQDLLTIPLRSSSMQKHWCSDIFFCRDEKTNGWFYRHQQGSVSVFPFQLQKAPLCTVQVVLRGTYVSIYCVSSITSYPSFLFLLLSFFF